MPETHAGVAKSVGCAVGASVRARCARTMGWGVVAGLVLGIGGCGGPRSADRLSLESFGASPAVRLSNVEGADHLAVGGYDVVSYVADGKAEKGTEEFAARHEGVTYRFVSAEHREKFLGSPEVYRPAYGGWCATAMGDGRFVDVDPTNFRVRNGRVFLFYRLLVIDAAGGWDDHPDHAQARADLEWAKHVRRERVRE